MNRTSFPALGTTASVVLTDPAGLDRAEQVLRSWLAEVDRTCSRFRADSEISQLPTGRACPVSPLLAEALSVALRAARLTDGIVDPTVSVAPLGYDRDFASVPADVGAVSPQPAPGWHRVWLDTAVTVPHGVTLDLGATAKAWAADRAAAMIAAETGSGTMVNLGGDIRVAGTPPPGGWQIDISADHADTCPETTVTVTDGGLATSGIDVRHWKCAGRPAHHIVDPRTGANPPPHWRTVTVAAQTCADANTASTAAIVLGPHAMDWLTIRRLPARLVAIDGTVHTTSGWPS